jgi:hypothetical protein
MPRRALGARMRSGSRGTPGRDDSRFKYDMGRAVGLPKKLRGVDARRALRFWGCYGTQHRCGSVLGAWQGSARAVRVRETAESCRLQRELQTCSRSAAAVALRGDETVCLGVQLMGPEVPGRKTVLARFRSFMWRSLEAGWCWALVVFISDGGWGKG